MAAASVEETQPEPPEPPDPASPSLYVLVLSIISLLSVVASLLLVSTAAAQPPPPTTASLPKTPAISIHLQPPTSSFHSQSPLSPSKQMSPDLVFEICCRSSNRIPRDLVLFRRSGSPPSRSFFGSAIDHLSPLHDFVSGDARFMLKSRCLKSSTGDFPPREVAQTGANHPAIPVGALPVSKLMIDSRSLHLKRKWYVSFETGLNYISITEKRIHQRSVDIIGHCYKVLLLYSISSSVTTMVALTMETFPMLMALPRSIERECYNSSTSGCYGKIPTATCSCILDSGSNEPSSSACYHQRFPLDLKTNSPIATVAPLLVPLRLISSTSCDDPFTDTSSRQQSPPTISALKFVQQCKQNSKCGTIPNDSSSESDPIRLQSERHRGKGIYLPVTKSPLTASVYPAVEKRAMDKVCRAPTDPTIWYVIQSAFNLATVVKPLMLNIKYVSLYVTRHHSLGLKPSSIYCNCMIKSIVHPCMWMVILVSSKNVVAFALFCTERH